MSIRRAGIILLTVIGLITSCGCGLWGKEETWEHMELTQEEKDVLCNVYIDDEKINQGELLPYQKRTVEQYRYAKEVLARKYPSYEFKITYCEPQTIMNEYMMLYFCEVENEEIDETVYTMYVYEGEDGYYAEDNFYDKVFSPKYEVFLYEELQETEKDIIKIQTSMSCVENEDYDENMTVEDVLSGKLKISPDTIIFIFRAKISESEGEEIFTELKEKIIKELDLYGSYQIMIINDMRLLEKAEQKALDSEEYLYKKVFYTWEESE